MNNTRRVFLSRLGTAGLASSLTSLSLPAWSGKKNCNTTPHVVVIGGGFGGATTAKTLKRLWPELRVTLIEPSHRFYTCPFTNLYLGGIRDFEDLGHNYHELENRYGVRVIHTLAEDVSGEIHQVKLANGQRLNYDKLVLSPGVDMRWNALEGYDEKAAEKAPHAWKTGAQTHLLKKQLQAMDNGGLFVMVAPANPFRCPPGPYERVSMVAHYLKTHKPRSKILLLDAKDSFSKQGLFMQGWKALYGDMIEWVGLSNDGRVMRVDADRLEVESEFGERHRAAVLNVIPPQKAGWIADRAGVTDASDWVPVKPRSFESTQVADIHVIGDASVAAPMPKSGFCANAQGKVAAMAIVASLTDRELIDPSWINTCYSMIGPDYGISVAGVYRVVDDEIQEVGGGVSPADADADFRRTEARKGEHWYNAICQDTWGTRFS